MKNLIIDYTPFCTRVALVEDGELIEFSVERSSGKGIVGNVYKGRVENVICGMQASFVNIGQEQQRISLYRRQKTAIRNPSRRKNARFLPVTSSCVRR